MLSQETSKGALGGKAEVTKPGGKTDGQAGKEPQSSHVSAGSADCWAHALFTLMGLEGQRKGKAGETGEG